MKNKEWIFEIKKELFRKIIHIMSALTPFFAYVTSPFFVIFFLALVSVLYSILEIFRCKGRHIIVFSRILEIANRKESYMQFSLGPITLSLGIMASLYLFPLYIATIAIFSLSFGDGSASLAGKIFGKRNFIFKNKTYAGSLSCFFATFISVFIFSNSFFLSLFVSFFTTIIELVPLKDFDNFVIPLSIGFLSKYYICFFC